LVTTVLSAATTAARIALRDTSIPAKNLFGDAGMGKRLSQKFDFAGRNFAPILSER
jgi:hypothetical protein